MIFFPNAKINLGLNILGKRKDGYHDISSLFYPIRLSDVLEVIEARKFSFSSSGINIPGKEGDNLVIRAYQLLKKDFALPDVSIHLHKSIPTGAGLGGGSTDGAYMLKMMNSMFELFLDDSILEDYALQLGSDCPFFIRNETMLASGRGDELEKFLLDLKGYYLYLVKPDSAISTREAYQLIRPGIPEKDIKTILQDQSPAAWRGSLKNDFETAFFEKLPDCSDIKEKMYEKDALYASMTGSGSAFFGIFEKKPDMQGVFPPPYFTWEETL
ncbi:MAG: 4-(cytidine 5'-diphospho)-2-C-methyl-D-erythritol kinase [Cyclobacteriaceae bacterium]|nr:4-(cytidine 5'-diphospho)-2-C-methyl-D-erythritol kinase [Cyclobacteriaceae bacterium]